MGTGPILEFYIGMAIEGMAQHVASQIAFSGRCSGKQLARLASEIDSQHFVAGVGKHQLIVERFIALDILTQIGRGQDDPEVLELLETWR